jgi:NADPH:quinone reductase
VLIQGASSGVGLMALQIAKLKGAKTVIGSSTDATRRGRLKEFGADLAVDSSDPGWVDQVLQATGGEGVDLIVDQVSGKVASQNLAATKIKGRIVNVGRLGGTRAEFNFDLHAARRINYIGVTFRTRSIEEIREIFDEVRKTSGARWNRANCNCRSTECFHSTISARRSSTWKPTSISARLS